MIPAWLVSLFAALASCAIWSVRAMPWRIRVSLILPISYFGLAYLWYATTNQPVYVRVDVTSLGLILIFSSIIGNSLLARWKLARHP